MADFAHLLSRRAIPTVAAAAYLGVKPATLRAWQFRGPDDPGPKGPPYIKLSPSFVVYEIADLDRFLNERRVACAK